MKEILTENPDPFYDVVVPELAKIDPLKSI